MDIREKCEYMLNLIRQNNDKELSSFIKICDSQTLDEFIGIQYRSAAYTKFELIVNSISNKVFKQIKQITDFRNRTTKFNLVKTLTIIKNSLERIGHISPSLLTPKVFSHLLNYPDIHKLIMHYMKISVEKIPVRYRIKLIQRLKDVNNIREYIESCHYDLSDYEITCVYNRLKCVSNEEADLELITLLAIRYPQNKHILSILDRMVKEIDYLDYDEIVMLAKTNTIDMGIAVNKIIQKSNNNKQEYKKYLETLAHYYLQNVYETEKDTINTQKLYESIPEYFIDEFLNTNYNSIRYHIYKKIQSNVEIHKQFIDKIGDDDASLISTIDYNLLPGLISLNEKYPSEKIKTIICDLFNFSYDGDVSDFLCKNCNTLYENNLFDAKPILRHKISNKKIININEKLYQECIQTITNCSDRTQKHFYFIHLLNNVEIHDKNKIRIYTDILLSFNPSTQYSIMKETYLTFQQSNTVNILYYITKTTSEKSIRLLINNNNSIKQLYYGM